MRNQHLTNEDMVLPFARSTDSELPMTDAEKLAWQNYERARTLYHITAIENAYGILLGGIRARLSVFPNGEKRNVIWIFTGKEWAGTIASSLGMVDFALFSIRKGAIKRETVRWYNAAGPGAAVSFYCLRAHISRGYVRHLGHYSSIIEPVDASTLHRR